MTTKEIYRQLIPFLFNSNFSTANPLIGLEQITTLNKIVNTMISFRKKFDAPNSSHSITSIMKGRHWASKTSLSGDGWHPYFQIALNVFPQEVKKIKRQLESKNDPLSTI
jgi:hypothetical protein